MDDDLTPLAGLLAKPEPPAEAVARSRRRLQAGMRGRAPRRIGWFTQGLGLAAVAAAAAVAVLATGGTTPAGTPAQGREVLLMAAVSAEKAPQDSGTYWHVRSDWQDPEIPPMDSWTVRDGRRWTRGEPGDPPDAVVPAPNPDPDPFMLKGAKVGFEDLEGLPEDPEALNAWIAGLRGREENMLLSEQRGDPTIPLIALISELPTPPKARSAAFRSLAAVPGVRDAGAVEGGRKLLIPNPDVGEEITLVVDPETARVTRTNYLLGNDGSVSGSPYELLLLTTDWTDRLPQTGGDGS
ncbi:CU044_5270 family protein [Streptosporangium sp. NPDC004379]|uniref:CU044_5270 family protein n=1 Tax=Streptosporangium sp. NPDC004379 TaxID=3366189 RepID=UPI0036993354